MKVLFLDIDGVLNSTRSVLAKVGRLTSESQDDAVNVLKGRFAIEDELPYGPSFTCLSIDQVAVGLVGRLLRKDADLRIVLSSTHRTHFCGDRYDGIQFGSVSHLYALNTYLAALGLPGDKLIDVTDRLHIPRGKEVKVWLDRHPEITHHCALDDGADFEPEDCNFVRTDPNIGLSDKNYFELCRHLDINESTIIF